MTTGGPPPPYGGAQPPDAPGWGPPTSPHSRPYPLTEEQLGRLPPPIAPYYPGPTPPLPDHGRTPDQRPAVIALATTLAVTASLLWISALSLGWLVASGASRALLSSGDTGLTFHVLDSFGDRMLDGLAVPLYAFPLASLVTGLLLLTRRGWTRVAHSVVGLLALTWSAWWLRHSLLEWGSVAFYLVVAVGVLWTPAATRWYARGP